MDGSGEGCAMLGCLLVIIAPVLAAAVIAIGVALGIIAYPYVEDWLLTVLG